MKRIIVVGITLFFATAVNAEDKSSGCGMGWEIFKKNSLLSSVSRSMTNATFSSTIAMTVGTSGCDKHSIIMNEKAPIHYAEVNYQSLMQEMAEGKGEALHGFAVILGCDPQTSFGQMTQQGYTDIFPTSWVTPEDLVKNTKAQIMKNPAACQPNTI